MVRRLRLDAELVRRGLARSRQHAAELVTSGRVIVGGAPAAKPATGVDTAAAIVVRGPTPGTAHSAGVPAPAPVAGEGGSAVADYVSRGGHKLAGALDAMAVLPCGSPGVAGRRCLDAGASTGGFTDVLLRRGAAEVVAVDVGYGQLAWSLRSDPRVVVVDRTNVRDLRPQQVGGPVDLVVGDLSFISLRLVLPALGACLRPSGDLLVMVKPQFEVGRGRVGSGGVVRDPTLRVEAVEQVAAAAYGLGLGTVAVTASPLPGPRGNVEFFLWLRTGAGAPADLPADRSIRRAVAEGPK